MGEISKAVGLWITQNASWTVIIILFVLSVFFKIPKKEINVLGWVIGWFGNLFTRGLREDIESMKQDTNKKIAELNEKTGKNCETLQEKLAEIERKQDALEEKQDWQSASRVRAHVLNFARSLYADEKHTREDFENVIKENEEYEALVKKYNWKNDVYSASYTYINECYQRAQREHGFLAEP